MTLTKREEEIVDFITSATESLDSSSSNAAVIAITVAVLAQVAANAEREIQSLRAELTGRDSPVRLLK